jgi:hypothetical protein
LLLPFHRTCGGRPPWTCPPKAPSRPAPPSPAKLLAVVCSTPAAKSPPSPRRPRQIEPAKSTMAAWIELAYPPRQPVEGGGAGAAAAYPGRRWIRGWRKHSSLFCPKSSRPRPLRRPTARCTASHDLVDARRRPHPRAPHGTNRAARHGGHRRWPRALASASWTAPQRRGLLGAAGGAGRRLGLDRRRAWRRWPPPPRERGAGGLGGQRLLPGAAEARAGAGAWRRRRRPWPRPARRSTTMDGITERWPRAAG